MWELKGMGLVDRRGVVIEGHGPGGSERCGN